MYEKDMVKQSLKRYVQYDPGRKGLCESLEAAMDRILEALQKIDGRPVPISANMVMVLHETIVAENTDQIAQLQNKFNGVNSGLIADVVDAAKELYNLCGMHEFYCEASIKLHEIFSGRCLSLAEANVSYHAKKLLLFTSKDKAGNELELLQSKEKEAKENFSKIDNFCSRYVLRG